MSCAWTLYIIITIIIVIIFSLHIFSGIHIFSCFTLPHPKDPSCRSLLDSVHADYIYSTQNYWTISIYHLSESFWVMKIYRYMECLMFMAHIERARKKDRENQLPFNTGYNFKLGDAFHFCVLLLRFHKPWHFLFSCCCWCHCWIDDKVNSFCIGDVSYIFFVGDRMLFCTIHRFVIWGKKKLWKWICKHEQE